MNPSRTQSFAEEKVITSFAQSKSTVSLDKGSGGKWLLATMPGLLLVLAGGMSGFYIVHYVNDPYRTLTAFPVSAYLENYEGLAGSKSRRGFRSIRLGLEGWSRPADAFFDQGRPATNAVLIPAAVANGLYFTKGQIYLAQIEVKEGGLIYADSFEND